MAGWQRCRRLLVGLLSAATSFVPVPAQAASGTQHYEYVFPDGGLYVYDIDHGHALVKQVSLPTTRGVRGVGVSPGNHALYVSYGGDGGANGSGSLLRFDLLTDSVLWQRSYGHGIDSFAINPAGTRIYMPDGELTRDGLWYVVDAANGNELGRISGGLGPHNTIVSLTGAHAYLGGRNHNYLVEADTATNTVIRKIGPLVSGVRPFTINGSETLAYTTATQFCGFQVSSITTGRVLYTVPFCNNFPSTPSAPSHGISLSPDEEELYVIDTHNNAVHVYGVSGLPASPPVPLAVIHVPSFAGREANCAYDCLRDGWLQHSADGCFVYVGDDGAVISTATRSVVATLPPLANTRKMLEIDWSNGLPVFTTSRIGLGYATTAGPNPSATGSTGSGARGTPSACPDSASTTLDANGSQGAQVPPIVQLAVLGVLILGGAAVWWRLVRSRGPRLKGGNH